MRTARAARTTRPAALVLAVIVAGGVLLGCSGSEQAAETYHPATVEEVAGGDVKQVTFTSDAAERVGLESAIAEQAIGQTTIPYAALIYDGQGSPWVYAMSGDLTFLRTAIVVDRIDGDRVWLSDGLPPGARVVTVGATEVYGAELEIGGGH